jgi:hypothetical protein
MGYQSAWSARHLSSRQEKNEFFADIGRAAKPGVDALQVLRSQISNINKPLQILNLVKKL